ncbi:hypothetical protein [Streptomyces sp. NPDC050287]
MRLNEALEGRPLIERAAFQMLVDFSREQQRKVRAAAADFTDGAGAHP